MKPSIVTSNHSLGENVMNVRAARLSLLETLYPGQGLEDSLRVLSVTIVVERQALDVLDSNVASPALRQHDHEAALLAVGVVGEVCDRQAVELNHDPAPQGDSVELIPAVLRFHRLRHSFLGGRRVGGLLPDDRRLPDAAAVRQGDPEVPLRFLELEPEGELAILVPLISKPSFD